MIVYIQKEAQQKPHLYIYKKYDNNIIVTLRHTHTQSCITNNQKYQQAIQCSSNEESFKYQNQTRLKVYYQQNSPLIHIDQQSMTKQEIKVLEMINQQKQKCLNNYQLYKNLILGQRNFILGILLKLILGCFLVFILLHYYTYKALLMIIRPINKVFSFLNYTPLVLFQNQMILKCNLINQEFQNSLFYIFSDQLSKHQSIETNKYNKILNSYFKILNILTFMIVDSALGLASVFITYYSITVMLSSLKYITQTLHILLINHKNEITSLKQIVSGNKLYSIVLQKIFQFLLQNYHQYFNINIDSNCLFNIYLLIGYLGFSFQIVSTIQFSYLTSINIFILYKIITFIYQLTLNILKQCSTIIKYVQNKTITIQISKWKKQPWCKIVSLFIFIFISITLPLTLVYYIWLVCIIVFFKVFLNILINIVNFTNNFPLGSILISLKKPYLYPHILQYIPYPQYLSLSCSPVKRTSILFCGFKQLFQKLTPIFSLSMIKEIFDGIDLLKQPKLQKLNENKLNVKQLFFHLMKF